MPKKATTSPREATTGEGGAKDPFATTRPGGAVPVARKPRPPKREPQTTLTTTLPVQHVGTMNPSTTPNASEIPDDLWVSIKGKFHPLYRGLLAAAHKRGMASITTTLLQAPTELNDGIAIAHARVVMKDGSSWDGLGDASEKSVPSNIRPHLVRMAETRAKGRALRDMLNIDAPTADEMSETDDMDLADTLNPHPY